MITVAESHKQRIIIMIMILRRRKNATACLLYGDMMGGTGKQKSLGRPTATLIFIVIFRSKVSFFHSDQKSISSHSSSSFIIMIIVATFLDFITMMMM